MENISKEHVLYFLKGDKIDGIIRELNNYTESKVNYDNTYFNSLTNVKYLQINSEEVSYWLERDINLSSDSDLLIDLIYRIPYVNCDKKYDDIETILEKVLQKINQVKK